MDEQSRTTQEVVDMIRAAAAAMREAGVLYLKTPEIELQLGPEPARSPEKRPLTPPKAMTDQERYDQPYFEGLS